MIDAASGLQRVLTDLIALASQAKHAQWTATGPNAPDLRRQLDKITNTARHHADAVADRMRTLRAVPDGRLDTVAATTTLPAFPDGPATAEIIAQRLATTAAGIRAVLDDRSADRATADLLQTILRAVDRQGWLLTAGPSPDG